MNRTFQNVSWKQAAIVFYVAMHAGILALTATLPLALMAMGEGSNLQTLALHCASLKKIQYWLLGTGGITLILEFLAIVSSVTRNRKFRIIVASLIGLFIAMTLALLIWGSMEGDGRKSYFQETWNDMDYETKYFIQTYYSCCGFENLNEWTSGVLPTPSSCYAIPSEAVTWPDGCYKRVVLGRLNPVSVTNSTGQVVPLGEDKSNPFVAAHFISLTILLLVQITSFIMLMRAILSSKEEEKNQNAEEFVLENPSANGTIGTTHTYERSDGKANIKSNGHSMTNEHPSHGGSTKVPVNAGNETEVHAHKSDKSKPWHKKVADTVSTGFGNAFYWIGVNVARHPKMTILYSVLLICTMTIGMLQRYEIPPGRTGGFLSDDNDVVLDAAMAARTFPTNERNQYILVVDESNVISTQNFQTALNIDKAVKNLTSSTGKTFSTICLAADGNCTQRSLFEFWSFDNAALEALSNTDIQTVISQNPLRSPVFGDTVDISHILGGIVTNGSTIESAKAHLLHYVTTSAGGDWEDLFIDVGRASYSGVSVYVQSRSSRRSETSGSYTKELPLLFAGFGLIFIYILVMTGKLSLLEHRVYIALLGVGAAGLSMAGGIGLTPTFGLKWTTLHLIVPFLVIGIGVDDMFVILQAWNIVEDDEKTKGKSLEEKSGLALQTAGVSITVTSVTDLVAFAVGATSDLAGFASFSVFVAMCIIILFFLECTFFMACVVLDQRRKERRYDACLACCYKHPDTYEPSKCSRREIFSSVFEDGLGRLITKLPFAIIAILLTLTLTGFMAWGFYRLQVIYDPDWYLPVGSYLIDYNEQYDFYFNVGSEAQAYVIGVDFFNERRKLHTLYENLLANTNLNNNYTKSWFEDYVAWASSAKGITDVYADSAYSDAAAFYSSVDEYLRTNGITHSKDVVFKSGEIYGSRFDFRHNVVDNEGENVDIMESARRSCSEANFTVEAFPYGSFYLLYEITRIIRNEVYRNLAITILCVFAMVLPILASLQMGIWVGLCVLFTTIDVAGTMYFGGLSIEASTIITLLLSVGLAVDYAAHVGHKFLTLEGTRKMRARAAIGQIGVAVFNGGFSTFLALVLLSGTDTYSYRVFFTVFSSVIGYGLWNGLVFLPCVLSLVGPAPYATANEAKLSSRHYARKSKVKAKETPALDNELED